MNVVLISSYELGRQPFGLASAAAWLKREGARVVCLDLSVQRIDEEAIASADLVAFYLPMHTATRIAAKAVPRIRAINPRARLGFYGLYAPVSESTLRNLGAEAILGGEFESGLAEWVRRAGHGPAGEGPWPQTEPVVRLVRQRFLAPAREGLAPLSSYARLLLPGGEARLAGYTEASRGCKHLCRHCPIVPVYRGRFFVVQQDVVLEDVRRQVAAGARHITFGDPDFLNAPGHSLALLRAMHAEHPDITYDVTIKIEHLIQHAKHLDSLRETGCLFITSAVESIDDRVLVILEKGHTRDDFLRSVELCQRAGVTLSPTFVAFTPWIDRQGYCDLLSLLAGLDLIEQVAPIQLAIRLLIPSGSRLLEVPEVRRMVEPFDQAVLVHPWLHDDPDMDRLQREVEALVAAATPGASRRSLFEEIWLLAGLRERDLPAVSRAAVPYLTEPWYC